RARAREFQLPHGRAARTGARERRRRRADRPVWLAAVLRACWPGAAPLGSCLDALAASLGGSRTPHHSDSFVGLYVHLDLRPAAASIGAGHGARILCVRLRLVRLRVLAAELP